MMPPEIIAPAAKPHLLFAVVTLGILVCAADIRADAADQTTDEQKARLKKEFSALTSRSIAFALASAGLIDKTQAAAVTTGFDTEGDPSCHPGP